MEKNRKKPIQKRSIKTVESILHASQDILKNDGPLKFSTNLIAKNSGVSVGSIYQYFQSKEKIVELLLEKELRASLEKFDHKVKLLFNCNFEERLTGVVSHISSVFKENDYLLQAHKLFDLEDKFNLDQFFDSEFFSRAKKILQQDGNNFSNKDLDQFFILLKQSFGTSYFANNSQIKGVLTSIGFGMAQTHI